MKQISISTSFLMAISWEILILVSPQLSSSTYSGRKSLGKAERVFYKLDALPVTKPAMLKH